MDAREAKGRKPGDGMRKAYRGARRAAASPRADEGLVPLSPLTRLLEWTGARDAFVVFESDVHQLTASAIWGVSRGRKNVAFVVETERGNVFGSFHAVLPKQQSMIVSDDARHFVFTMRNELNTGPMRFLQNETNENQLIIHRETLNDWIFGVGYAFHIRGNDKSYIGSASGEQLDRGYRDPLHLKSVVFNGTFYPNYFSVVRLLLVQMV